MLLQGIFRPIELAWTGIRHRLVRAVRAGRYQVDLPRHGALWVDETLDFVGDTCLRTNLLTKLTLEKADAGTVYEIRSDNLSAAETIPFMLPNCNCELLAVLHDDACKRIYVRKRKAAPVQGEPESGPSGGRE